MKLTFALIVYIFLTSCFKDYKVEITNSYIINERWKNNFANFFEIERMQIKQDSSLNIFEPGFEGTANNWNIVKKLEEDSTFIYHYISKSNTIIGDTIYFNKSNEGNWNFVNLHVNRNDLGAEFKTIGNLKSNNWYKFSHLRDNVKYYVFVYVDSAGATHLFDQNLANF